MFRLVSTHKIDTCLINHAIAVKMTSTATALSSYLVQPDLRTPPPSDKYDTAQIPFSFALDPFQQHAISAIQQEHNVLVCAKTGSGKTLVGEYQIHYSLAKGKRIFYTTPIKSLSITLMTQTAEKSGRRR